MLRQILIVHRSEAVLSALNKAINANLSDAAVFTAESLPAAIETAKMFNIHLILLSPMIAEESLVDIYHQMQPASAEQPIPVLLLTEGGKTEEFDAAFEAGVAGCIELATDANTLCQGIDRICCPKRLREARRYSLPHTQIQLSQAGCKLSGKVINISEGGLLCQLNDPLRFDWALPSDLTLIFNLDGAQTKIPHMQGLPANLNVVRSHPDYSPAVIRVAFRFVERSEESVKQLNDIFISYGLEEELF